jgi:hypothetical protein
MRPPDGSPTIRTNFIFGVASGLPVTRPERRSRSIVVQFLFMPGFKYLHAVVVFFIGAIALYWGITGKDIYSRALFQTVPLPKPIGRILCFAVAGVAIYFLVGDLR